MATYYGRTWTRRELLARVGSVEQVAGARRVVFSGGKADGVEAVDVNTGAGLRFTILPGRGMDIGSTSYRETPLAFYSGTGITSPGYYEEPGLGWLRGFYGGLLTTCGITSSGAPSTDLGRAFGLHGRLSNAAAEDVSIQQAWDGDDYVISVRGTMREAQAMFENLRLTRTISASLGVPALRLHDIIENVGFEPQPLMMLYHMNFGWPLLSSTARVVGPFGHIHPRDAEATKDHGVEEALGFPSPVPGYAEKVFYHSLEAAQDGRTAVALLNEDCAGSPLGIVLRFNRKQLGCFTEWKMPREGFYVLGLEPGTVNPAGRGPTREAGKLPMIPALGRYDVELELEVVEGREGLEAARRAVEAFQRR